MIYPPARSHRHRLVSRLQGSCLCGAIAWQVATAIQLSQICVCHCQMCRRFSGSTSGIPFAAVERSKLWPLLQGFVQSQQLKSYQSSALATRYFCGTCASPIVFDYTEEPHTLWIPMGSLVDFNDDDDDSSSSSSSSFVLDPTRDSHIFCTNEEEQTKTWEAGLNDNDSIPHCVGWGLYKQDPCQPNKDWDEIPTLETPVRLVVVDDEESSKSTD